MRSNFNLLTFIFLFLGFIIPDDIEAQNSYALVLHGGAGTITEKGLTPEQQEKYSAKMKEALLAGEKILAAGGSAEEAVVATIKVLEESPLFNAGVGAVLSWDSICELDASIMRGSDLNAGAVAGVSRIKSPISAARAVMNESDHVMLSGKGAENFASEQELEMVDPEYFITEKSMQSLGRYLQKHKSGSLTDSLPDWKYGTVGCVALDKNGNIAAGTSTGGMTGKRYGRIGDSPVIGAGTYADNSTAGVSCTGHGEYFIRNAVAYDLTAMMKYGGLSAEAAGDSIIFKKLLPMGGSGGLIALDRAGNVVMVFNTAGMFRAYIREGEEAVVKMFKD